MIAYQDCAKKELTILDRLILQIPQAWGISGLSVYVLITALSAAVLSFAMGLERELRGEPTGLSTHVVIAVSCSLLMTMSIWAPRIADGNYDLAHGLGRDMNYDTSRIAAGIVSGVGFLGAGTIIKTGANVKGLSTAATVWTTAAVGMACGAGLVLEAIIVTVLALTALVYSTRVKHRIDNSLPCLKVAVRGDAPIVASILSLANANGMIVRDIDSLSGASEDGVTVIRVLFAYKTADILLLDLGHSLLQKQDVAYVECNSVRLSA